MVLPGGRVRASAEPEADALLVRLDGLRLERAALIARRGTLLTVLTPEGSHSLELRDPLAARHGRRSWRRHASPRRCRDKIVARAGQAGRQVAAGARR